MAAFKLIILLGIVGIAVAFSLPEHEYTGPSNNYEIAFGDELPVEDTDVQVRKARSPQGKVGGSLGQDRFGTSGSLNKKHNLKTSDTLTATATVECFGCNVTFILPDLKVDLK